MKRVLYKFIHGLGDAVQFTCVLQHLAKYRPDHAVDVAALIGKQSVFHGQCGRVYTLDRESIDERQYQAVVTPGWYENYSQNENSPYTKVCNFLREECQIEPDESCLRYRVNVRDAARETAEKYLRSITRESGPRFPVVAIHYEGNTSSERKNLDHGTAAALCETVIKNGRVPLIFDWDRRSPFPDQRRIFCPDVREGDIWGATGTGDGEMIAALIDRCEMMIGIDSGPLHVAGATETPTIGVWTEHTPIHFFDLCPNVLHFIPDGWQSRYPFPQHPGAAPYFLTKYRSHVYSDLLGELQQAARGEAPRAADLSYGSGCHRLVKVAGFWIRAENTAQDMVIVRDVYQGDCYQTAVIADRIKAARFVVDIGAHIGCFARRVHEMNPDCQIVCVECCPENIPALRRNVGDFAQIVEAACTYDRRPLAFLNAYFPNCKSTGGSMVIAADTDNPDPQYRRQTLGKTVTLEEILNQFGRTEIDLLKLDCEESEFSILGETPSLAKIRFILGEYHGRARWEKFRADRFAGWDYGQMSEPRNLGNFHLRNPFI